jgi:CDP-paratose 2-epimerase
METKVSKSRSVLIFGGAGFIGANLARHLLLETDANVHLFDNLSRRGVQHNLELLKKAAGRSGRLRVTIGDVRNAAAVERVCKNASEIYHLAAQVAVTTAINDPRFDFETNVIGTFNVLEGARLSGNRPFLLFTSTNKVYGEMAEEPVQLSGRRYAYLNRTSISEEQPLDFHSPYGCSKGAADQYVREYSRTYGLPAVVFRMSCIAGEMQYGNEDQGWVSHFLYSALRGDRLVIYGDGSQVRDVLHVGDLICAIDRARSLLTETAGQIYNVGGGSENAISLVELVEEIELLTGQRFHYSTSSRRPGDQLIYVSDYSKIANHTGWKPSKSVRQTLAAIYEFWEEHREIFGGTRLDPKIESGIPVPLLERAA